MKDTWIEPVTLISRTSSSALIDELRSMSPRERNLLEVSDRQLAFGDLAFRVIQLLLDDEDPRPPWDRLAELDEIADALLLGREEAESGVVIDGEIQLPRWLRQLKAPSFRRFIRKLLGPARIDRLSAAGRADAAIAVVAVRRSLRSLLSFAAAADNCIGVLSSDQRSSIAGLDDLSRSSILELAVQLDDVVNRLDEKGIRISEKMARPSELADLPGPIGDLAASMSQRVSEESVEILEELSELLTRKIRGAKDALAYSSDGVSQAANSLVELIDRMLRDAFAKPVVLDWVGRSFPNGREDMTYENDGQIWPTKRAEVLCFSYGGLAPGEHSLIHELAAAAVVECRSGLQKLKHSDTSTEEEEAEVIRLLQAVEAAMVIVIKITWLPVENGQLEQIRARLAFAA